MALLFVANLAAYSLRLGGELITTMWVPAGVIMAAYLFAPFRLWPVLFGLFVGVESLVSLVVVGSVDPPKWAVFFAISTPLHAALGAWILRSRVGWAFLPDRLRSVVWFLVAALLVPALGAAWGATGVHLLNPDRSWWLSLRKWWFGDSLGILALVPLLSAIGRDLRPKLSRRSAGTLTEYLGLMVALVAIGIWTFGRGGLESERSVASLLDVPLLIGPVLLWTALRFGPRALSIALALTSVLCIREAVSGNGPFVRPPFQAEETVIAIQAFLVVAMSSVLLLAAMVQTLRRNVVEMQATRERLDQLTSRINVVLWMFDPRELRYLYVSPAYDQVWGRDASRLEKDPWDWLEAVHPDDRERLREAALARRRQDGSTQAVDITFRILRPDGELRWIWSRSFPLPSAPGEAPREVGNAIDITHQRAAEEQQRKLERQLLQAQKMEAVGQLASGIAHDLNNVLTVVQGHALILADPDESSRERGESLQSLERAVDQARGVTSSLLTFARGLTGQREPFSIAEAVTETARLLSRTLPASIELDLQVELGEDVLVLGDRTQIQQVLLNLTLNARDAMPDGGRLELGVRTQVARADSAAERVVLTVRDSGVGIPAADREHLFEPFFSTKERGQGTGLGLSVVLGIVTDHDGAVHVDSEPGTGTLVTVELPPYSAAVQPAPMSENRASEPSHAGQRLLLAEDSDGIRTLLVAQLGKLGFGVDDVADGDALYELVCSDPHVHRLWVLDLDLPRRSGLRCLREFRERGWQTPAILITGDAGAHGEAELDDHTEILLKPFTVPELAARIQAKLEAVD